MRLLRVRLVQKYNKAEASKYDQFHGCYGYVSSLISPTKKRSIHFHPRKNRPPPATCTVGKDAKPGGLRFRTSGRAQKPIISRLITLFFWYPIEHPFLKVIQSGGIP